MAERYRGLLPLDFKSDPGLKLAYQAAFNFYYETLTGQRLPGDGSVGVYEILCKGYEVDNQSARQIAESSRRDVFELLDPDIYLGSLMIDGEDS